MFDKLFTSDAVYRSVDFAASRALQRDANRIDAIYAYEDCAAQGFQMAHKLGIQCIYDLPIAYWETAQKLYQEESERWPDWVPTMPGLRDQQEKFDRKSVELELADVVICPSEFVANSIASSAIARRMQKKTVVIPFGSPSEAVSVADRPSRGPLNVLFVGSMTQRKGLADLFQAVRILGRSDVRLTVMGAPISALNFYRERLPSLIHEPPRSHREVLALMDKTDVLVLPSIVEGRALVVQEAMSRGLPVIVTPNTGVSDLVRDNVDGFVIPIRSPEMIADRLAWMADHRDLLADMGCRSRESARKNSWTEYRHGIEVLVKSIACPSGQTITGESPMSSSDRQEN
jgi:glycosyltransferase involved in cell wall biosynthesis